MNSVPKIVLDRLKAQPPAASHPDADVLTAFAERSLADRERATVLDHLARCGDCREVVALAMPEKTLEVAAPVPARGWLSWPVLRWGFVAAGVVIAAGAVLQLQTRHQTASSVAKVARPVQVAQNENKKAVSEFVAPPAAEKDASREKLSAPAAPAFSDSLDASAVKKELASREVGGVAAPAAGANRVVQLPHGPKGGNVWQQNSNQVAGGQLNHQVQNQAQAPPGLAYTAPAPASPAKAPVISSEQVVRGNAGAPVANQPAGNVELARAEPALKDADAERVARAKSAPETVEVSAAPVEVSEDKVVDLPSVRRTNQPITVLAAGSLWTVNRTGSLQRSSDNGRSWQTVNVNAAPGPQNAGPQNPVSQNYDAKAASVATTQPALAKAKDEGAHKRDAGLTFNTVAANGTDLWAGGSAGALYHSVDGGDTWSRVAVGANGVALTGDILGVTFTDGQHGKVTTSTPETWSTADAGQTWQKQ